MLRSLKDLEKCHIEASDGPIGDIQDFYFDEELWVVRYLVVHTGVWLSNRSVLISPHAIRQGLGNGTTMRASLTKDQVTHSPLNDGERSISRELERTFAGYYGYPVYWSGAGLWGNSAYPGMMLNGVEYPTKEMEAAAEREQNANPHLRSCNNVAQYYLHAQDGDIGHLEGYLIDDKSWAIRFLVVNTSNWWLGHQVLIAPEWIDSVSWLDSTVTTDLTREAVRNSPAYDPKHPLDDAAEAIVYQHYARSGYATKPTKRRVA